MFDYCHLVAIWYKLNLHPIPQKLLSFSSYLPRFSEARKELSFSTPKDPKNCGQRLPGASVFSGNYLNTCQPIDIRIRALPMGNSLGMKVFSKKTGELPERERVAGNKREKESRRERRYGARSGNNYKPWTCGHGHKMRCASTKLMRGVCKGWQRSSNLEDSADTRRGALSPSLPQSTRPCLHRDVGHSAPEVAHLLC